MSIPSLRKATALFCLLFLASLSAGIAAQTKPTRTDAGAEPIRSLLWVGNSFFYYNNSMHGHYNELARAAEPEGRHRGISVTISGSGLDWHDMASLLRPTASAGIRSRPATRSSSTSPASSSTP